MKKMMSLISSVQWNHCPDAGSDAGGAEVRSRMAVGGATLGLLGI